MHLLSSVVARTDAVCVTTRKEGSDGPISTPGGLLSYVLFVHKTSKVEWIALLADESLDQCRRGWIRYLRRKDFRLLMS